MYIYIYKYTCIYKCMNIHVYIHIWICTCIHIYAFTHVCICICIYMYVHIACISLPPDIWTSKTVIQKKGSFAQETQEFKDIHICIHIYMYKYIFAYIFVYDHMYACRCHPISALDSHCVCICMCMCMHMFLFTATYERFHFPQRRVHDNTWNFWPKNSLSFAIRYLILMHICRVAAGFTRQTLLFGDFADAWTTGSNHKIIATVY